MVINQKILIRRFPVAPFYLPKQDPLAIKPSFDLPFGTDLDFTPCLIFFEQLIRKMIPQDLLQEFLKASSSHALRNCFLRLNEFLPIFIASDPKGIPGSISFNLLCSADLTQGVGRYVSDVLSRWLIPGKIIPLTYVQSFCFQFVAHEGPRYFIHQVLIQIDEEEEFSLLKNHLPLIAKEIRLNILAVKHARGIASLKRLSIQQKKALIQDNLSSLIDRPSKNFDLNIFDQMHHFLIQLTAEERIKQLQDKFLSLLEKPSNLYDRDIFNEIQHFVLLFRDKFISLRPLRHIGRIISFQYLFRKFLEEESNHAPHERHLSLKLFKTKLQDLIGCNKHVLGILVGINFLKENELFGERHIFNALGRCLPNLKKVKDSYVLDRRSHDKIRLFYMEVEKEENAPFISNEIKDLRKLLYRELKESFETVTHPIFMPRNEEEIMRYIIILSQELKYVHDLPQMVISFEAQSNEELCFTVILLRIKKDPPLDQLFLNTNLKFLDHQTHHAGSIRKRHLKEAHVFRVSIDKKPFLRKDYSLDLFKARQAVFVELTTILGEIRDYNGGIFSKQQEVLHQLRELLIEKDKQHELLLDNFFYSLSPPLRQSLLPASLLKSLFLLLLQTIEHDYKRDPYFRKTTRMGEYGMIICGTKNIAVKENIVKMVNSLKIPSADLTLSSLYLYDTYFLGYLYKCTRKEWIQFLSSIEQHTE